MSSETPTPNIPQPPAPQQQIDPRIQELQNLIGELIRAASELAMSVSELTDKIVEEHPELKDLRDSAMEVTRIIRKIMKLSKRTGR